MTEEKFESIKIAWLSFKELSEERRMKLFNFYVAEGDPIPAEALPK